MFMMRPKMRLKLYIIVTKNLFEKSGFLNFYIYLCSIIGEQQYGAWEYNNISCKIYIKMAMQLTQALFEPFNEFYYHKEEDDRYVF